jgi:putative ABC transport system substrate-binding protein
MRRREFLIASAVLASGMRPASAQQVATKKRIAMVHPSTRVGDMRIGGGDPGFTIYLEELQRLGYVEGQNLIIDRYSAEGQAERYGDLAREAVSTNPDLIVVSGTPITAKLKAVTSTIPITALTGDPVRFGLVSSLAHPGGNITGVSFDAGVELWGKRLELLVEAIPRLRRALFVGPQSALDGSGGKATREAAERLGIALVNASVATPVNEPAYRRTFDTIRRDQADGLVFAADFESYPHRLLLVELVKQIGLPAVFVVREQAIAGGLMSYATDLKSAIRTSAAQGAEILRGGNPAEMPYVQGTRFELVINLKTAKALGIEIPTTLLARADEVIE